ncbi:MAG: S46 family peptidase, partial [Rhodothermaceae bacterium]|nr:S46 family peptidase [Rhodothermaceae bacterium]
NHHCAQGSVIAVDQGGEGLLDAGFYARGLDEERPVPNMTMDQLVAFADVTDEVNAMIEGGTDAGDATDAVEARLLEERGGEDGGFLVQVRSLYNGGRYSAYIFRRYTDVRLVAAPEKNLGFFGGDPDNFTYPRYALDFAFFRVYDEDGEPLETEHYFPLSEEGVAPGDLVFVIGNPGSTSRGLTVAQLEYVRDVQVPTVLAFLDHRVATLRAYLASGEPESPDAVRGQIFGLSNAQKAYRGRRDALADPYILARRAAAERAFRAASPEAGALIDQMAQVQATRMALAAQARAFQLLFNGGLGSATLLRARAAYSALQAAAPDFSAVTGQGDRPAMVERAYLEDGLATLQMYFAALGQPTPAALQEPSVAVLAERLLNTSALASQASATAAVEAGTLSMDDPVVQIIAAIADDVEAFQNAARDLGAQEGELNRQIGRARFGAYGASVPPDATFSPRLTDGIVKGYAYNGTMAPPMTTLSGLYDRYYSFCEAGSTGDYCEWELPQRWLDARDDLDLSTPVNFVSTSDTIGGNSGSPALNQNLELVGLNFDRTIEGLVRDYIYLPDRGRNVMVDVRVVLEALDDVYDLDGLVTELTEGTLRE